MFRVPVTLRDGRRVVAKFAHDNDAANEHTLRMIADDVSMTTEEVWAEQCHYEIHSDELVAATFSLGA